MFENFNYAEIVLSGVQNRGNVRELKTDPDFYGKKDQFDCYMSAYRFTIDYKTFADENKTVRNYSGICHSEYLFFDFDSPHADLALDEVRKFTCKVIEKSTDAIIDDMFFYFSGNKGFHILIKQQFDPSIEIPETVKKYCMALGKEFTTFDRSIYDKTRILRIPNSKHRKSGLYKIPLLAGEVLKYELDEIKEIAKQQRSIPNAVEFFSKKVVHNVIA